MNPKHLNLNPDDYLLDEDINRLYGEFEEEGPASTTGARPSSSTPGSSKKRKKKSIVWDCFDLVMQTMADGRQVEHACCPRFRFKALKKNSTTLGEALGLSEIDVAEHLGSLKSQIFEVFSIYVNRYRHNDDTVGPTPPQQQSKLMRVFLNKTTTSRASGSSSKSQSEHVELNKYLSTEYSITDNDGFKINDLLKWWQNKRNSFLILSRLAHDVLAIPVSTVSLEQAFSTARRIIEDRRCSLAPDAVEALTCLKDWENERIR
ncbi:hypothetical protein Ddye_012484 [Dipteronia dyeriana]|uniref:HAT C-terminal dimerisation domain-containing protein n=1 Tax=Dipteronia dyeriana TaxID=168575 RepID=A0AAD9X4L8_9ROSI|nr:hypothetical protein Ddye_012484 [Dipteronia dyeriana]